MNNYSPDKNILIDSSGLRFRRKMQTIPTRL